MNIDRQHEEGNDCPDAQQSVLAALPIANDQPRACRQQHQRRGDRPKAEVGKGQQCPEEGADDGAERARLCDARAAHAVLRRPIPQS